MTITGKTEQSTIVSTRIILGVVFCIKCIQNDEFCIKNDGFCMENDEQSIIVSTRSIILG